MAQPRQRVEFGDFQTPDWLARDICQFLHARQLRPCTVVEPTCGVGSFVIAALDTFDTLRSVQATDINAAHLAILAERLQDHDRRGMVSLQEADFFERDWKASLGDPERRTLVLGNLPWVTNSALGALGSSNLPQKSNFLGHAGFDAISGKANFDISESMLLSVLDWFRDRPADIAILVKTAVARKVLSHAERRKDRVTQALLARINAKAAFNVSVDACLLLIRLGRADEASCYDYSIHEGLDSSSGRLVGHRHGLTVADLAAFEANKWLLGTSPEKWRSGVKHDASGVMELSGTAGAMVNGLGEPVELEPHYLYPLLKGSDIGGDKAWRQKWVLVTQKAVGEPTETIRVTAPKTWAYLQAHAAQLDGRTSTIYDKAPRFSIFGIGPYAFRPWRIAVCGLYKSLSFRLIGPIQDKPAMFDDTVYYLSFADEATARSVWADLHAHESKALLESLIFWDDKRPIKSSILNLLDWTRLSERETPQLSLL